MQLCHTQEELLERDIDQHQLLKILKDKGEEYVYDEVNEEEEEEEIFDHLDPLPAVLEDDEEEEEGEGNDFCEFRWRVGMGSTDSGGGWGVGSTDSGGGWGVGSTDSGGGWGVGG